MSDDTREDDLRYAARPKSLALVRTGDVYALVKYELTRATLDEVAAYLSTDGSAEAEHRRTEERNPADKQAMHKAQLDTIWRHYEQRRRIVESGSRVGLAAEDAGELAKSCRRQNGFS